MNNVFDSSDETNPSRTESYSSSFSEESECVAKTFKIPSHMYTMLSELNITVERIAEIAQFYDPEFCKRLLCFTAKFDDCMYLLDCINVIRTVLDAICVSLIECDKLIVRHLNNLTRERLLEMYSLDSCYNKEIFRISVRLWNVEQELAQFLSTPRFDSDEEDYKPEKQALRFRAHFKLSRSNEKNLRVKRSLFRDDLSAIYQQYKSTTQKNTKLALSKYKKALEHRLEIKQIDEDLKRALGTNIPPWSETI